MNNNGKKIFITIITIVTIAAICLGFYIHIFRGFNGFKKQNVVSDTVQFDGDVKDVDVNSDAVDMELSYGDKLSVEYKLPENQVPDISFEDGKLLIKQKNSKRVMNFHFFDFSISDSTYLKITIPEGTELDSLKAQTDAGDLTINDLTADDATITTDAGDIKIINAKFTDASTYADAGNIKLENTTMDTLNSEADAGNINLTNCETEKFTVETDAGNVTLENTKIDEIDAELDAGNIKATDCTINGGEVSTDVGNITLKGEIGDVKTDTDVGNVDVD